MKGQFLLLCPKLPSGWSRAAASRDRRAASRGDTDPVNTSEDTGEQEVNQKCGILPHADE